MAAGLGFKTFTTGEVLTAADTNGYLMQGVLVFASSAARAAAITSPQEGQYSYLKDTNSTEYYDGAAWIAAPIGDITGVTAGAGISGGGTSGTVTITNSMATEITAAGDIIVGTGSGTFDNLPIGTTAQVLTADTTVSPYKVKWATPASSGGMTLLSTTTLSGASTTISSIDQTYTNLYAFIYGMTNATADGNFIVRPNNLTSAYYGTTLTGSTFGTIGGGGVNFPVQARANVSNIYTLNIPNYYTAYNGTSVNRIVVQAGGSCSNGDFQTWGVLATGSAVTSLVFLNGGGNFSTGTVLLYGVK